MRPDRVAMTAAAALLLSGCASGGGTDSPPSAVELTPEVFADVVADHVGRQPRRVEEWDVMTRELGVEAPGAWLPLDRRVSLRVAVAPTTDHPLVCGDDSFFDECVDLGNDGDDGRVVLGWQELEPEEDPGVVYVIDRRHDEDVVVGYSGASITGDPRDLDLGISVDQMADIVTDERLTLG